MLKGKGVSTTFPSEEERRCNVCTFWLIYNTMWHQSSHCPLQEATRDVLPRPATVPHEVAPIFSPSKLCCSGAISSRQRFGAHHDPCNAGVEATASWVSVSFLPNRRITRLWKVEGWKPTSSSTCTLWRPVPSGRN